MSTFIASAQYATDACFDVYHLPHNTYLGVKHQSLSIICTALQALTTLPASTLSNRVIASLFVGASCAQFTSKRHYVEKMMQVTRISLVAYRAIFGSHKQRAAIALVVAIAALNHKGFVPIELQYLYLRYEHYLHFILTLIDSENMTELQLNFTCLLPLVLDSEHEKQKIERRWQSGQQVRYFVVQQMANNCSAGSVTNQHAAPAA